MIHKTGKKYGNHLEELFGYKYGIKLEDESILKYGVESIEISTRTSQQI